MNRKLLVTGGAGFIGANFVHYWLANYPNDSVVVFDALTYAGNKESLSSIEKNKMFTFIQGDICDFNLVKASLEEHCIDTIVHFAAESHVDRSIDGPDAFIETNIVGTYALLKAAKSVWIDEPKKMGKNPLPHRFHHVSTDEVYGSLELDDPAFTESTQYAPNSPYSASKAASDHLVRAFHHTYGLDVTTSNCSNNYGPYHFPEKLIPLIITNILRDKGLPVYGDGKQIRDWLYVDDHAKGIDLVLEKGMAGSCYNIGGNNEWKNIDIVNAICSKMNQEFKGNDALHKRFPNAKSVRSGNAHDLIEYVVDRPGHDRRYAIDPKKSNEQLGFVPNETFDSGLQKTIEWYLVSLDWWNPLVK